MKEKLLELIYQTEEIEKEFHTIPGDPIGLKMIGDVEKFTMWLMKVKAELNKLYEKKHNQFVWETINLASTRFDGYEDKRKFDKLKGALYAIADDIDTYFPEEKNHVIHFATAKMVGEAIRMKQPKIFISHSSQDKEQAKKLVTLFEQMGLNEDQIFCSSVPGYDIGIDGDIFEGIKQQFSESELHLVYLLSGHYYDSAVSLNEMGAAWIVQAKYTLILLPGFNFEQIKGVVNKNQIGIKLDNSRDEVKDKLNQLYDNIVEEFKLQKKKQIIWEEKRDSFIDEINR